ncbi:MAG: hypothetical protein PWQ91_815 [Eubacteriales bacterium]|nr:hypothetical protein [Eubacteriales bacterium]MDN5363754.1 hypothetical protein [Eubacteriales bacterium]
MTVKIISCDVFREEILALPPPPGIEMEFLSIGLHLQPDKLREKVQEAIDRSTGCSLLILGYGLCGGALDGVRAPGCPMVMPRVHDCIPVLLGSMEKYRQLREEKGQCFYFSGGWVEGERLIISEYERSCRQFGEERALRIFRKMFEHYTHLAYIFTGHPRTEETLAKTRWFASLLPRPCFEVTGSLDYLRSLLYGPWEETRFVTIPPHGSVDRQAFVKDGVELKVQGT